MADEQEEESSYVAMRMVMSVANNKTIPKMAYAHFQMLSEVCLPYAETIGQGAFMGCTELTEIDLPSATKLDSNAFQFCSGIRTANLPQATQLGDKAFAGCKALTNLAAPSLQTIGISTFQNCEKLASVDISRVRTLPNNAFYGCTALEDLDMSRVTSIGKKVFRNCVSLKHATLPHVVTFNEIPFQGCVNLKTVDIPNVDDIQRYPFGQQINDTLCINLKYVNMRSIPSGGIEYNTFKGMSKLKCINLGSIDDGTVNSVRSEWGIRNECDIICKNYIQTRTNSLGSNLQGTDDHLTVGGRITRKITGFRENATIPDNYDLYDVLVSHVAANSFSNNTKLDMVYFPSAVEIGTSAFAGCSNLTQVRFPTLSTAGDMRSNIFKDCPNLKYIDLGSLLAEDVRTRIETWKVPSGCTILCSDGVVHVA